MFVGCHCVLFVVVFGGVVSLVLSLVVVRCRCCLSFVVCWRERLWFVRVITLCGLMPVVVYLLLFVNVCRLIVVVVVCCVGGVCCLLCGVVRCLFCVVPCCMLQLFVFVVYDCLFVCCVLLCVVSCVLCVVRCCCLLCIVFVWFGVVSCDVFVCCWLLFYVWCLILVVVLFRRVWSCVVV